jgi:N-acetylglutamate synthase-like GNAT family acetyltransferase
MIRQADHSDIPELVEMLVAFQSEAGCYAHIDPCRRSLTECLENMLKQPDIAPIAVYEKDGKVAGSTAIIIQPSWFNDQQKAGQELWWYIKPEYRGSYSIPARLFKWLEMIAESRGMQSLTVASTATLQTGKLGQFYENRGFVKADVFYIKRVR